MEIFTSTETIGRVSKKQNSVAWTCTESWEKTRNCFKIARKYRDRNCAKV